MFVCPFVQKGAFQVFVSVVRKNPVLSLTLLVRRFLKVAMRGIFHHEERSFPILFLELQRPNFLLV